MLVNLDSLSLSELRNLAIGEGLMEEGEEMDRDDLVGLLGGSDSDEEPSPLSSNVATRYVTFFSDYKGNSERLSASPGVETLPDDYCETSIDLVLKNSDWAYAFWSFSPSVEKRIGDGRERIFLTVESQYSEEALERYDIDVDEGDREWSIGIPSEALSMKVFLTAESKNGERREIASSLPIALPSCRWLCEKADEEDDDALFALELTLVTDRSGEVIENGMLSEVIRRRTGGDER